MEECAKSWVSHTTISDAEGEEVVKAMIAGQTITTRPHASLPPGSNVEWPHNLQFHWARTTERTARGKKDTVTMQGPSRDMEADEARDMQAAMDGVLSGEQPPAPASSSAQPPPAPPQQEFKVEQGMGQEAKDALASIRKWHGEFDRKAREFKSTLVKSAACEATKNSYFEGLLASEVKAAEDLDRDLLSLEVRMTTTATSSHDIADGADLCERMSAILKRGQKSQAGLKLWIRAAAD